MIFDNGESAGDTDDNQLLDDLLLQTQCFTETFETELRRSRRYAIPNEDRITHRSPLGALRKVCIEASRESATLGNAFEKPYFADRVNASLDRMRIPIQRLSRACPDVCERLISCFDGACLILTLLLQCSFNDDEWKVMQYVHDALTTPITGFCEIVSEWCSAVVFKEAPHLLMSRRRSPAIKRDVASVHDGMDSALRALLSGLRTALEVAVADIEIKGILQRAAAAFDMLLFCLWPPDAASPTRAELPSVSSIRETAKVHRVSGFKANQEDWDFLRLLSEEFLERCLHRFPELDSIREEFCRRCEGSTSLPRSVPFSRIAEKAEWFDFLKLSLRFVKSDRCLSLALSAASTIGDLQRYLINEHGLPPTIKIIGVEKRKHADRAEQHVTLSVSQGLWSEMFGCRHLSMLRVFECHDMLSTVAEISIDSETGIEDGREKRASANPSLRVMRGTPAIMTRMLSDLKAKFETKRFQEGYFEAERQDRGNLAMGVQRIVLPRYGFQASVAGVIDMQQEVGFLIKYDSVTYRLMGDIHDLLDTHARGRQAELERPKPVVSGAVCCQIRHRAFSVFSGQYSLSSVEELVAVHFFCAQLSCGSSSANNLSMLVIEKILLLRSRGSEEGQPLLNHTCLVPLSVADRACYISTEVSRRKAVCETLCRAPGYYKAQQLVRAGSALGLKDDTSVSLMCSTLETIDKLLVPFLQMQPEVDTSDLVSQWNHGHCDLDAAEPGGATLLHLAAADGQVTILRALLALGACANVPDELGRSPAHWASIRGNIDCLAALAARPVEMGGADVDMADLNGRTPREFLKRDGRSIDVAQLQQYFQKYANFGSLAHVIAGDSIAGLYCTQVEEIVSSS